MGKTKQEKRGAEMCGLAVSAALLVGALLSGATLVSCNRQTPQQEAQQMNASSPAMASADETGSIGRLKDRPPASELLATAPSMTSVHQVWTSSSSDSLEELSPEMIGKLRNDIPFLAAYALRPRLMAGAAGAATPGQPAREQEARAALEAARPAPDAGERAQSAVLVAASSVHSARKSAPRAAANFNELQVETSSTSKSEHHHRQKASLKRLNGRPLAVRRSAQARRRPQRLTHAPPPVPGALKGARSRGRALRLDRLLGAGPKRRRITRGHAQALTKTTGQRDDRLAVKGGDEGLAGDQTNRGPPFYAGATNRAMESAGGTTPEDTNAADGRGPGRSEAAASELGDQLDEELADVQPRRVGDEDVEEDGDTVLVEPKSDGVDDDPELPSSEEGEARPSVHANKGTEADEVDDSRAGDRFAPEADERGSRAGRSDRRAAAGKESSFEGDDGGRDQATGGGIGATLGGVDGPGGSEARHAQKGSGDERNRKSESGVEFAEGAGNANGIADDDDHDDGDDDPPRRKPTEGVEGSSDEPGLGAHSRGSKKMAEGDTSSDAGGLRDEGRESEHGGAQSGSSGDEERVGSASKHGNGSEHADRGSGVDGESDLDYRDDVPASPGAVDGSSNEGVDKGLEGARARGGEQLPAPSLSGATGGGERGHEVGTRRQLGKGTGQRGRHGHALEEHSDGHSGEEHCVHEHEHGHHHHTIDWLRGAIPGEPDDDYPILARANSSTSFKCSEQKHAGYYADVESRCQIFHICQADGRQDSFLCPNGTVFSQKTLVCVWWNGFNCEDAPKFYHLNELLYKSSSGSDSPQSVAIPDSKPAATRTSQLKPRGMTTTSMDSGGVDESIEGLVRRMRGRRPQDDATTDNERDGGTDALIARRRAIAMPNGGLGERTIPSGRAAATNPDDEATIQRKSTNLDDADRLDRVAETPGSPSQIRAKDKRPPRRRRASTRQAPPKLKSRRVLRNSRRRKLRHSIKPRRRS